MIPSDGLKHLRKLNKTMREIAFWSVRRTSVFVGMWPQGTTDALPFFGRERTHDGWEFYLGRLTVTVSRSPVPSTHVSLITPVRVFVVALVVALALT